MLGNLLIGFIVILVGVVLAPTIANSTNAATTWYWNATQTNNTPNPNMSSASITLLNLSPLFYNLAIAVTAIDIAIIGLRNSGLMH